MQRVMMAMYAATRAQAYVVTFFLLAGVASWRGLVSSKSSTASGTRG